MTLTAAGDSGVPNVMRNSCKEKAAASNDDATALFAIARF